MSACIAGIAALLLVIGVLFMFGKAERPTLPLPPRTYTEHVGPKPQCVNRPRYLPLP
jgi:hypothetical protein